MPRPLLSAAFCDLVGGSRKVVADDRAAKWCALTGAARVAVLMGSIDGVLTNHPFYFQ